MGTPFYNSLKNAGLIDADYVFINGTLYDIIGGRVVTATGCRLQRNGLSIPSLQEALSSGNNLQGVTELTSMVRFSATEVGSTVASGALFSDIGASINKGHQIGFSKADQRISADFQSSTGTLSILAVAAGFVGFNKTAWASLTIKNNDAGKLFLNGTQVGSSANMAGKTYVVGGPLCFGNRNGATRHCSGLFMEYIGIKLALTEAQQQTLIAELNSISYPTSVYEIRPPDYPTVKDGTPSFALCCGETTDKANGATPTTATAVERKKDTQMADYLQFTRTSSSKLDYGIQTQNQLNAEFEWDGDVYFDTDAVGQVTEIIKVGDSATGVCFGLRKLATEKFQFIYGNELTVDFTYAVPSLGPLHIVLRREWVSGTTYDVKLWVNGAYKEKVTGTYAGTGNASAKTYIGYSGNVLNTNYLSGRIYYCHIYPHLRPVEKFQRDPFSKNLTLGCGIRANNTVNTVARDTDNVVTVMSGDATFKVNSGFGQNGKLQKYLQTTAAGATFYVRGITNANGITLFYRTTGTLAWTQGDGTTGVTVAADGLFTMPATTELLWSELGGSNGIIKENQ